MEKQIVDGARKDLEKWRARVAEDEKSLEQAERDVKFARDRLISSRKTFASLETSLRAYDSTRSSGCPECGFGKVAGCWRCGS